MNVESGVVVPRLQPFDFVGVKDFLIFQRGQIPGTQANGNSGHGTPFSAHENVLSEQVREAPMHEHWDGS